MERKKKGLQGSALAPLEQGDTSSSKRRREKGGRDIDESIREKNARPRYGFGTFQCAPIIPYCLTIALNMCYSCQIYMPNMWL